MMTAAVVILTATAARADDTLTIQNNKDQTKNDDPVQVFKCNELSADGFLSFIGAERRPLAFPNTSIKRGLWGGGIGVNYFWSRDVGISIDSAAYCGTPRFIQYVNANLLVRFPIEQIRLAPYLFAGAGRAYNPGWSWMGDAGVGFDFRICPKLALFTDGRYVIQNLSEPLRTAFSNHFGGLGPEQLVLRAGVRFVF